MELLLASLNVLIFLLVDRVPSGDIFEYPDFPKQRPPQRVYPPLSRTPGLVFLIGLTVFVLVMTTGKYVSPMLGRFIGTN